jgi:predicted outer membrane protein
MVGMLSSRFARLWRRGIPVAATAVVISVVAPASSAWAAPASRVAPVEAGGLVEAGGVARPVTADPFDPANPGDVSDGKGALPPANNPPSAGAVVDTALPGANVTQTRFGPLDDTDRLFLVKVRQAGLWERPTGLMAQQQAENARFKEIGGILAADHVALDEEDRFVAKQLGVALPDRPSPEQQAWMREFGPMKGHDFDVTAVKWLRFAHGGVFSAIASVRANTRNEMMRLFAERANNMVNKHMSLLESTGLVQYDNLPHAAIGAPAVALAAATNPAPKNPNLLRPPIIGLVIVTGLLAVVSVRRVVRGS